MVDVEARIVEVPLLAHRRMDQRAVLSCVEGGVVKFAYHYGAVVGVRGGLLLPLEV
jgi:hypothetical protein